MRKARTMSTGQPIKRVVQKHDDGCGMACVAMLAGVSYWVACETIFGSHQSDATSLADVRCALMDFGVQTPEHMTPFWDADYTQLRNHALLALDPRPNGQWHWAVWDAMRRRIVDPLKTPSKQPVVVGFLELSSTINITGPCADPVTAAETQTTPLRDR